MKLQLKNFSIAGIFAASFTAHLALADIPKDIGLLPLPEQAAEFKRYDLATEGSHYYSLWCGTSDNDIDGYGIQYNYYDDKYSPEGAKITGGNYFGPRFYYKKDISIDSINHTIIFEGVGRLNKKLTKLTLESGVVKQCSHVLEDEAIQNESDE